MMAKANLLSCLWDLIGYVRDDINDSIEALEAAGDLETVHFLREHLESADAVQAEIENNPDHYDRTVEYQTNDE